MNQHLTNMADDYYFIFKKFLKFSFKKQNVIVLKF